MAKGERRVLAGACLAAGRRRARAHPDLGRGFGSEESRHPARLRRTEWSLAAGHPAHGPHRGADGQGTAPCHPLPSADHREARRNPAPGRRWPRDHDRAPPTPGHQTALLLRSRRGRHRFIPQRAGQPSRPGPTLLRAPGKGLGRPVRALSQCAPDRRPLHPGPAHHSSRGPLLSCRQAPRKLRWSRQLLAGQNRQGPFRRGDFIEVQRACLSGRRCHALASCRRGRNRRPRTCGRRWSRARHRRGRRPAAPPPLGTSTSIPKRPTYSASCAAGRSVVAGSGVLRPRYFPSVQVETS
jgi:hypothetical protein